MLDITYQPADVGGLKIFYREARPKTGQPLLLLRGFPSASQMFGDLSPQPADRWHMVAPNLPGPGQSDMPDRATFAYTYDDYGAPTGFRLAFQHPA